MMANRDIAEVEGDELVEAAEATRTRLESSFEELQRRLDPGYQMEKIMESAQHQASEATSGIGETLRGAAKKAVEFGRRNPTIMTSGIMLAAFDGVTFMLRRSLHEWMETGSSSRRAANDGRDTSRDLAKGARDTVSAGADEVQQGLSNTADKAGDMLSKGRDAATEKAASLLGQSQHTLNATQQTVVDGYNQAAAFAKRLSREHPVVMMTTAVAAGMLIAVLLPRKRVQEKTLGGLGQSLAHAADKVGNAARSAGQHMADTTGGTSLLGADDLQSTPASDRNA